MKQRLKGLLALVLSLVMVLGMVTVSYGAATDYKITENTVTHVASVLNGVATVSGTDGNVTITLDSDINGRIHFYNNNGNFVLDLAGHTIDASGAYEALCLDNNFNGSVAIIGSGTLKTGSNNIIYKGSSATLKFDVSGGYDYFTLKKDGADVFTNEKNTTATSLNETYFKGTALVLTQGSATTYPVSIGGVSFNEFNLTIDSDDITDVTGTATYDPATSTLTLNNFAYNGSDGITATENLTIDLIGSNTVADTASATSGGAVVVVGDLKITSENNGSLNASSSNNNGISANNITIDKADLTVGCLYGLNAAHGTGTVAISNGSKLTINATTGAINCRTLNLNDDVNNGGSLWYQWTTTNGGTPNTSKLTYNGEKYLKIEPITYTVTFDANGHGTAPSAQSSIAAGGKVTELNPAPTAAGWTFGGWYKEQNCTTKWDFNTDTVTADITLYAKWTENSTGGPGSYWSGPNTISPDDSDKSAAKTESPNTFDGGIASAVVVTILSATGGAWLAKKKD